MTKGLCITELNGSNENLGGFNMTKRYSPTRRDAYVSAEGKRKAIRQERTLARTTKTLARAIAGGAR